MVLFSKAIFMFSSVKTLENIKEFNHKAVLTSLTSLDLCEFLYLFCSSEDKNIARLDRRSRCFKQSMFLPFISLNSIHRHFHFHFLIQHGALTFPFGYSMKPLKWVCRDRKLKVCT